MDGESKRRRIRWEAWVRRREIKEEREGGREGEWRMAGWRKEDEMEEIRWERDGGSRGRLKGKEGKAR